MGLCLRVCAERLIEYVCVCELACVWVGAHFCVRTRASMCVSVYVGGGSKWVIVCGCVCGLLSLSVCLFDW